MSAVYNFYFDEANGCQRAIITSGLWSERPTTGLTNGQRYFATDRSIEYAYNTAISQWLSTQLCTSNFIPGQAISLYSLQDTQEVRLFCNRPDSRFDVYVEEIELAWSNNGSFDIANTFKAQAGLYKQAQVYENLGSQLVLYQAGRTNGVAYTNTLTVNTKYAANVSTNTVNAFQLLINAIGTPSDATIYGASLRYRLVG